MVATAYGAGYRGGSDGILDHRLLTCVIDRDGLVVQMFEGAQHSVDELLDALEPLLVSARPPQPSSKLIASASSSTLSR